MAGVMYPVVVQAFNELKLADRWLTPFLRLSTGVPRSPKLLNFLRPFTTSNLPVTVQLMGVNPQLISECAEAFAELGVAGINLNAACPVNQVVRKGGGGSLLQTPQLILEILDAIQQKLPNFPISVKLRTGFDKVDFSWYNQLESLQLSTVFLHFRTVSELYEEKDFSIALERFKQAKELLPNTKMIGNGDIVNLERFNALKSYNYAGAMVGRGLFENPFLLQKLANENMETNLEKERQLLFLTIINLAINDETIHFSNGRAIELARMILGEKNLVFDALKMGNTKEWKNIPSLFELNQGK